MAQRSKRTARFQYGLRTLLLLPVLFAVAWWWVTWPERTRHVFVRLIDEGRNEQANEMIAWEDGNEILMHEELDVRDMLTGAVRCEPRSWKDVIVGRRVYVQRVWSPTGWNRYITIERGRIKPDSSFYYPPVPDDFRSDITQQSPRE